MPTLSLAAFAASLANRAARQSTRTLAGMAPRAPSIGTRFLTDLTADCDAQSMRGVALPLAPLARAWCEANYPTGPDRKTPWATLESQVRVAAKAGALPSHVAIVSAKEAARVGLPSVALIIIGSQDVAASLQVAVRLQADAIAARAAQAPNPPRVGADGRVVG